MGSAGFWAMYSISGPKGTIEPALTKTGIAS